MAKSKSFWETFDPPKPKAPEPVESDFMNVLIGECVECGAISNNVMFGCCEECA